MTAIFENETKALTQPGTNTNTEKSTKPWITASSTPSLPGDLLRAFFSVDTHVHQVDASQFLSTASIVAIYEHLGLVDHIERSLLVERRLHLVPQCLWSKATHQLILTPSNALGVEMKFIKQS